MPRLTSSSAKTTHLVLASVFATSMFFVTNSFAAGGGGGGGGGPGGSGTTVTTPTCKKKKVWDRRKRKCVRVKKSSRLDDDNIYEGARDLAYHRRYEEAITLLKLAKNKNDPRILNYMGFANRKLGKIEKGLTYYKAALKADPDYTLVMEYMGEAFLQLGDVDKAREQLTEIEKRCGKDCHEYSMLSKEINAYLAQ